ncbi:nitric oxide synthase, partial [Elysia marginata]
VYVQDVLLNNAAVIYDELINKGGHFYVCGDVSMAHDVTMTLTTILQEQAKIDEKSASDLVTKLRDSNRIHEDIFGVGVRRPGEVAERPKDQSLRALQYLNATSKPSKPDTVKEKAVPITPTKRKSVSKPRAPMKNIFVKQRISPEAKPS